MTAIEALDSSATKTPLSAESALTGLFERHGDRIFGFCLRRLGSRQEAEDACQNTFLNAFRALQRGVRPLSETAWLFKIAENACLAAQRRNGRRRIREIDHDPELVGAVPAGEDESATAAALRAALDKLPPNQRHALLLREWRGLSYREIATELGLTVAAVETLIFRARRNVARTLSRDTGIGARLAGVLDLGSLVGAALKSAFSGTAAVKLAAVAAVVTLATLPAGDTALVNSSSAARDKTFARAAEGSASVGSGLGAARPSTHTGGRDTPTSAPAAGKTSRPADNGDEPQAAAPGGPGGSGAPGATGGPPAVTAPDGPAVPREVEVPAPPKFEIPAVPEPALPPLPQLPQLPQAPAPELPKLPEVPALPALPALPDDPTDQLKPSPEPK